MLESLPQAYTSLPLDEFGRPVASYKKIRGSLSGNFHFSLISLSVVLVSALITVLVFLLVVTPFEDVSSTLDAQTKINNESLNRFYVTTKQPDDMLPKFTNDTEDQNRYVNNHAENKSGNSENKEEQIIETEKINYGPKETTLVYHSTENATDWNFTYFYGTFSANHEKFYSSTQMISFKSFVATETPKTKTKTIDRNVEESSMKTTMTYIRENVEEIDMEVTSKSTSKNSSSDTQVFNVEEINEWMRVMLSSYSTLKAVVAGLAMGFFAAFSIGLLFCICYARSRRHKRRLVNFENAPADVESNDRTKLLYPEIYDEE